MLIQTAKNSEYNEYFDLHEVGFNRGYIVSRIRTSLKNINGEFKWSDERKTYGLFETVESLDEIEELKISNDFLTIKPFL